jgi:hypothetical protein
MTNLHQIARNYRLIGDVPYAVVEAMLMQELSPMQENGRETHLVTTPHSALFWAQAWLENQWKTTGIIIQPEDNNPMGLRPWLEDPHGMPPGAIGHITAPDGGLFLRFESDADCAREWRRRLFDDPDYKGGVYARTTTLNEMLGVYAPSGDVHPVTGLDNADVNYLGSVTTMLSRFAAAEGGPRPMVPTPY